MLGRFFFLLLLNQKTADILQPTKRVMLYKFFHEIMAQEELGVFYVVSAVRYVWNNDVVPYSRGIVGSQAPNLNIHLRPHSALLLKITYQVSKEEVGDISCNTFK